MRYLLDTHTYYWTRTSPHLLSTRAFNLISDQSSTIMISIVTPWELAIKAGTGKLRAGGLLIGFEDREQRAGFSIEPLTTSQVIRSGLLPSHHRDPFDRVMIAQALELDIPIISNDRVFDLYGVQRIWG